MTADIYSIAKTSDRYNLHCHTPFCDGHAPMEDFVIEALDEHFTHLGFTPHAPTTVESECNMTRDEMPAYLAEIERLRLHYGSRINILAGLEIDYVDGFGPSDDYFQSLPLDYRIGSVHFIPSIHDDGQWVDIDGRYARFKVKMKQHFDSDIEWVVRTYYQQMTKMIEQGGFDIVGHFDKIGFNASLYRKGIDEEPWYDHLVFELFQAIMDHGYIIEINTKAWLEHNRLYPHLKYFGMLKKYDAKVVFNSDSHYPTLINSGRTHAMRLFQLT